MQLRLHCMDASRIFFYLQATYCDGSLCESNDL